MKDEIVSISGQVEPPGMHMIYLPYSDDVRPIEELHTDINPLALRATEDQIKSATSLVKCVDLKNFSVCQFANPATNLRWNSGASSNVLETKICQGVCNTYVFFIKVCNTF
ncbi:ATP-dependent DNA helicase II subunit 1 [Orobanche gracilis]